MEKNKVHIIFHIDFNAFFCSVAEIYNPALRNTAFAIGRENSNLGVISTASYEARKYGITSGMPLALAYKKLRTLNVISLPYSYYLDYHNKFINLLKEYTNLIEVGSIDEAYIDVTKLSETRHPLVIAKEIQTRLLKEYHLPCSIGIATTLYLAKMASDLEKPLGLTVMRNKDVKNKLYPLSVKDIFGIGKKTYPKLIDKGIKTIGDFLNDDNKKIVLEIISEDYYNEIKENFKGHSRNTILPLHKEDNLSISTMTTYDRRLYGEDEILFELNILTKEVFKRLKKDKYLTKTINITIRNSEFKTITRSKSLDFYTNDFVIIFDIVTELLEKNYHNEEIRLLGVGFSNLIKEELANKEEYNLFNALTKDDKVEVINDLIDKLGKKYGPKVIHFAKNKTLFD